MSSRVIITEFEEKIQLLHRKDLAAGAADDFHWSKCWILPQAIDILRPSYRSSSIHLKSKGQMNTFITFWTPGAPFTDID